MQFHSQSDADILFARGQDLKAQGLNPYPHNFNRTYSLYEVNEDYEELTDDEDGKIVALNLCGRVMSINDCGELIWVKIEDQDSGLQLSLDRASVEPDQFTTFRANVYRGDYLGFEVDYIYRQNGWITARIVHWQFLALCIFPLPMQLNDSGRTYRQRYVQLAADMQARRQFVVQSKILHYTRRFLEDKYSFLEVNTPILGSVPHSNQSSRVPAGLASANLDAVLCSSAEPYLKQLLVGGLERIYEIRSSFNNEALDWQNSPELRVIQCYMIVADLDAVMKLTEHLIVSLAQQLHATRVIPWKSFEQMLLVNQQRKMDSDEVPTAYREVESEDILIDLIPSWSCRSVDELVQDMTKINFANLDNLDDALNAARQAGVELNETNGFVRVADVQNETIRQLVVPSLIQPTFLVDFPSEDVDFKPSSSGKSFELYINGLKFAEGSSGLTDPWDYKERQAHQLQHPQTDQTPYSDEVLNALKYGMPPSASVTIYLDRLIMLLTGAVDIRDVIYFPLIQHSE